MTLVGYVEKLLRDRLAGKKPLARTDLAAILRLLAKWRAAELAATIAKRQNGLVLSGPFAGMAFTAQATEGSAAAQLLGHYEHELHATIEALIANAPATILNIGCATGYYAVGLARRMPGTVIHAYDIDVNAQKSCTELARRNGVGERVIVRGRFEPRDFIEFGAAPVFALIDIEGAELDLLGAEAMPALARMSLLVECHDCFRPGTSSALAERFAGTHHVTRIDHRPNSRALPDWLASADQLDQAIATWEWRQGPTPWLFIEPR